MCILWLAGKWLLAVASKKLVSKKRCYCSRGDDWSPSKQKFCDNTQHLISPCLIAVTLFQMLLKLGGLLASVCRQVCVFHANYSGRWQPASDKSNHKQVLAVGRSPRLTSPGNSNQFRKTRFPSNQRLPGVKNWSLGLCDWHFLIKQEQWATRNVQATSNNEKIKLCEKLQC